VRVLVTGGAGFIGRSLTARLVADGHHVTVMDNLARSVATAPELCGATLEVADIRDAAACERLTEGQDAVVHLAAQSNVMGSEANPALAYETNVTGTWNLLNAAKSAGIGHFVYASSREVYGDAKRLPVPEATPLCPRNVYGSTKAAGEVLVTGAGQIPTSVFRLANVIGPGDAGRVVPLWLAAARAGAPLTMFGGQQIMDLVPMASVIDTIICSLERGPLDGPINVGSGVAVTLRDLADRVLQVTASSSELVVQPAREAEVQRYCADTTRLRCTLGIEPDPDPLAAIQDWWDRP
jgi:UDP-glucose 4-epimerase